MNGISSLLKRPQSPLILPPGEDTGTRWLFMSPEGAPHRTPNLPALDPELPASKTVGNVPIIYKPPRLVFCEWTETTFNLHLTSLSPWEEGTLRLHPTEADVEVQGD